MVVCLMKYSINNSFQKLKLYCEKEGFKGWDPYDGLNSKVFQALPFFKNSLFRLIMIQGFKRSPINFRRLFLVPKQYNAKGIGLFLNGYCNIYKAQEISGSNELGTQNEISEKINFLADLLLEIQSKGDYHGACWGYNFDWQNRVFFQPSATPTVVATSFCTDALFNAYEVIGKKELLEIAISSCNFVINDLNRSYLSNDKFIFSYSPLDNSKVYNASLLGAKLLARGYYFTKKSEWKDLSLVATKTIVDKQSDDGSWIYGEADVQNWIDSFHTGYNLDALISYQNNTGDDSFNDNIEKGFDFYLKKFFEDDGTPKYYHNKKYPIDIHCPGQLFVTLSKMNRFKENSELAEKVLNWTIKNMQDKKGYFYYQLKKGISSKISYMRWSNAFMFNALSYYILEITKNK